jgi:hypothetical protein
MDSLEREGDDTLWNTGCNGVREYLDGGELAAWIRAREPGVDKSYSQKLASRTIDAMIDIAKGRLYTQLKNRRKDGLRYKERRVILPEESTIPGERTSPPQTADVGGE